MADDNNYNTSNAVVDVDAISDLTKFLSVTSLGNPDTVMSDVLYGISHRYNNPRVYKNRDSYGLAFFTRPCLNLSNLNVRNVRQMYDLLRNNQNSLHTYVRCMLDPRTSRGLPEPPVNLQLDFGITDPKTVEELGLKLKVVSSPLVDEYLPFIPVLTNLLISMSGWPDIVLPTFTSKEGVRREQWIMGDGYVDFYEAWDLDCNFRNMKNEPLIMMFETWLRYIAMVHEGLMSPYMDFIIENEMDYNTRIYRLVLDENKQFVKKISATGAAFPTTVPNGKFFDYESDGKYNLSTNEINIRFRCVGAEYNTAILVHEFNQTVGIFNPAVWNLISDTVRTANEAGLVKIPFGILNYFNFRGYPLINKDNLELEWYIPITSKRYKDVLEILELSGSQYADFIRL